MDKVGWKKEKKGPFRISCSIFFPPSFFSFKRGWKKGAKKPTEEQVSKQRKE
jgi:hypothetical protein